MTKVNVFFGPSSQFKKYISTCGEDFKSLNYLINFLTTEKKLLEKFTYDTLVVTTKEYAMLSDSGINNLINIFKELKIENIYLQNPPKYIYNQLKIEYKDIDTEYARYQKIDMDIVNKFYLSFDNTILGQNEAKDNILIFLYKLAKRYNNNKPLVLLFYGPSGVGKTETAKYIAELLGEKLFRKQFSMYHTEDAINYLFGNKHFSNSLSKDLIERDSNVILFDEFDKANPIVYSVFYQMFDEGVFVDENYEVKLNDSIIICTSNYLDLNDVKKSVGVPIFNRFDMCIEYSNLNENVVKNIIEKQFEKKYAQLDQADKNVINKEELLSDILNFRNHIKNVREISKLIDKFIFMKIVNANIISKC